MNEQNQMRDFIARIAALATTREAPEGCSDGAERMLDELIEEARQMQKNS